MTGLNHATTGIAIALVVKQPALAPFLAFASHFVLDSVPHFGHPKLQSITSVLKKYIAAEAISMTVVTLLAMYLFPTHAFLIGLCAFVAFAPDLIWFFTYFTPKSWIVRHLHYFIEFSKNIQWYEKPPGLIVEAVYFACIVTVIVYQYGVYH